MCVRSFITVKKDRECFWRRHQKGDRVSSLVIMTQCKERLWRLNQLTALSFTNLNCNDSKRNSGTSNSPNQSPNTKFMLPGWYGCLVLQHMKNFTDLNTSILRLILLLLHTYTKACDLFLLTHKSLPKLYYWSSVFLLCHIHDKQVLYINLPICWA